MKIKQLIKTICLAIFVWAVLSITSNAASTSLNASTTSVTVGTKVTVTASGNAASWNLTISGDGVSSTSIVGYTENGENGSFSKSVSFTPSKAGSYTINLTGDVTDEDDVESTSVNRSVTITAKAKSSSSNSSSGSSSSGSSSNNSSSSSNNSSRDDEEDNTVTFRDVNEKWFATDSVNVRASYSTSSERIGSLSKGDEVTVTGTSSEWARIEYNGRTAYVSMNYLTQEEPEESDDKSLRSLTVDGYILSPQFSSDVTEYTLTVGLDVTSLDIEAIPTDEASEVTITGNDELLEGTNTVEIVVTAEDGTERTYTINVIKGEGAGLGLAELTINGYTLNPAFSPEIYEYTLEINDLTVTSIDINAVANVDGASVEIVGNTELKPGENIVTIIVRSDDGNEITTYQIIVNIVEAAEEQLIAGIDNDDLFLYGGIALAVIIILIIIIVVVRRRRKTMYDDDDEYEPYYGGFDSLNKDVKPNYKEKSNSLNSDNNISRASTSLGDTQDLSDVINNKNVPDDTQKIDVTPDVNPQIENNTNEELDPIKQHRKSVIEENFGADIKNDDDDYKSDRSGRKKGKHF